ncbi:hypothetical protein [Pseudosulfitobacter pseudonitzschiae]|uniref:hypothetical protein n=1 Tax=Pseudosulfitobacter pseudonitzschiae TaxID=1402135 RepID=UPI001AF623CA|nr:hypothetical protein [Pseudosulfitobacter pseudonitzschiae]MBM1814526.1 hypothetical protein [Pseudosulfitobacter pseudonitzschiae]MBM1831520.1 hypothetical protein [Pseudosulfitobacter pseudonitzschiae]MBM1836386.1 hypothetical protein [Pseudosulfitobacter pseudonitzschiae]MBM1841232.1 hypothetical protein [Pseudosulfitobacter pseudonitzschiae]MBM1846100.1 hypothetical protein [Pseudosulfitobacter pseudonitzschiae]
MKRSVEISPDLVEALELQREVFVSKFGREPEPTDPIFFDPDSDTPTQMSEQQLGDQLLEAMRQAQLPGHLIYAYEVTGQILTEETYFEVSRPERRRWNRAIKKYFQMNPSERPD